MYIYLFIYVYIIQAKNTRNNKTALENKTDTST